MFLVFSVLVCRQQLTLYAIYVQCDIAEVSSYIDVNSKDVDSLDSKDDFLHTCKHAFIQTYLQMHICTHMITCRNWHT